MNNERIIETLSSKKNLNTIEVTIIELLNALNLDENNQDNKIKLICNGILLDIIENEIELGAQQINYPISDDDEIYQLIYKLFIENILLDKELINCIFLGQKIYLSLNVQEKEFVTGINGKISKIIMQNFKFNNKVIEYSQNIHNEIKAQVFDIEKISDENLNPIIIQEYINNTIKELLLSFKYRFIGDNAQKIELYNQIINKLHGKTNELENLVDIENTGKNYQ